MGRSLNLNNIQLFKYNSQDFCDILHIKKCLMIFYMLNFIDPPFFIEIAGEKLSKVDAIMPFGSCRYK